MFGNSGFDMLHDAPGCAQGGANSSDSRKGLIPALAVLIKQPYLPPELYVVATQLSCAFLCFFIIGTVEVD